MRERLTKRQAEWLQALCDLTKAKGYPPTQCDLGKHMGTRSKNGGALEQLDRLHRKGWISRVTLKDHNVGATSRTNVPLFWPNGTFFTDSEPEWPDLLWLEVEKCLIQRLSVHDKKEEADGS